MATAREYLQSVIQQASQLQNKTDADLEQASDLLQEADDSLTDALNQLD